MTSKHTPGPWTHSHGERPNFFYIDSPSGDVVYVTGSLQPDHAEANARLIAAAPELLEAAMAFIAPFDGIEVVQGSDIAKARAAIAKATGEA